MTKIAKASSPLFIILFSLLFFNSVYALEMPSIVGEAKKVLLGPVDEYLGYEPIKDMPVLIIPINIIEEKDLMHAKNEDKWLIMNILKPYI